MITGLFGFLDFSVLMRLFHIILDVVLFAFLRGFFAIQSTLKKNSNIWVFSDNGFGFRILESRIFESIENDQKPLEPHSSV